MGVLGRYDDLSGDIAGALGGHHDLCRAYHQCIGDVPQQYSYPRMHR